MGDGNKTRWGKALTAANVLVLTFLSILGIIDWYPKYKSDQQQMVALGEVRDNPSGILTVRDLGAMPDGQHQYDLKYTVNLKNTSNEKFMVTWSADQLLKGSLPQGAVAPVARINEPPNVWGVRPGGAVAWQLLDTDGSIVDTDDAHILAETKEFFQDSSIPNTSPKAGLTGWYAPGFSAVHNAHFLLRASPDEVVSIAVYYGFDKKPGLFEERLSPLYDNTNMVFEVASLKDATTSSCRLGIEVENSQVRDLCSAAPASAPHNRPLTVTTAQ